MADAALEIHLPQPILGMYKPLPEHSVAVTASEYVRDSPPIANDRDRRIHAADRNDAGCARPGALDHPDRYCGQYHSPAHEHRNQPNAPLTLGTTPGRLAWGKRWRRAPS
jgi:hypothetical protein